VRFGRTHPWDYTAAAERLWLAIALMGAAALAFSFVDIARKSANELLQIIGWTSLVAIAAAFPIRIPRSKHSIVTGDVLVFLLLAVHGTAAAAIAAGIEGLVGSARTSARLSSRIASVTSSAASMTFSGALFAVVRLWLEASGLPHGPAHLMALAIAALAYLVASTMGVMQIVCLKRGAWLSLTDWYRSTSWVGTLYLFAATLAGLLSLSVRQFGASASIVGVGVLGLALELLRSHFHHLNLEHQTQEARVAAARLEAEQNQKRFDSAFAHTSIGMAIVSHEGIVLQANRTLCALLGRDEAHVLRRPFRDLLHTADVVLLDRHVRRMAARREDTFSIELRCHGADQREIWVSLHCALFDDRATAGSGLIFQVYDITSQRRVDELNHIAYHDHLTDLANRTCFQERLAAAVERTRCEPGFSFAVMYMDLDHFKATNDSHGHGAGDELLKEVARRLRLSVRQEDLVARLSGDEFAILLEQVQRHEDVLNLAHSLLQVLAAPFRIDGTELWPQASIGITFSDLRDRAPGDVMRDADAAMYKAKAEGRARFAVFDAGLHSELGDKLQLEADLQRALAEQGFTLVFQPLFGLAPHRLLGFEALARWTHPQRGPIDPAVFIALAEKTGCIGALTDWVIAEAAAQLAGWRKQAPHLDLAIHVNVSGNDLSRPSLVTHVRDVLQRHRIPPQALMLELTESTLMERREPGLRSLVELRQAGVRLGIDDFGVGYSSLARLSTLPFDCLKIDRSFVIGMQDNPHNVEIIRAVLSLANSLNKVVIAEGIETQEQLSRLKQLGVPIGQGFLLGRPVAADQIQELLRAPAEVAG